MTFHVLLYNYSSVQGCSVGNYHTLFPGDEILQINQQLFGGRNVSTDFAFSLIETTADELVSFGELASVYNLNNGSLWRYMLKTRL